MKKFGWLIARYLVQSIFPYFLFSWLLLTVILFVQQASRYADIFFSVNIPANLVWQLTFALIPNVIAFTCPMAVLVGTIIGLTKMQGDSELIAIRAAGVANRQILIPVVILGTALSLFALWVNVKGVPFAAGIVRRVALQSAIKKLESPIEPGVFNTEVAGYTIYVRGGDIETGQWNGIFIYNKDEQAGVVRLITSGDGRIDVTDQNSELVLSNAYSYTFPVVPGTGKFIAESIGQLRLAIKTKRNELVQRLANAEVAPEELGLSQLVDYAATKEGKDKTEAEILWQRRVLLSITPLIFCILGASIVLRFNRGGRGFGVAAALAGLIIYYLFAFLGEQLARTGHVSVFEGGLIPVAVSATAIIWFSFSGRLRLRIPTLYYLRSLASLRRWIPGKAGVPGVLEDLTTGLRDFDISINLLKFFFLSLGFLGAIFVIFTAFELWKFAGSMDDGVWLLAEYLFFLLPFVYIQLAPSSAMIAVLATYVIKSRQNEIVTWTAAGQSIYRLLAPCFLLMTILGFANWQIQERLLPSANKTQEELRSQIRSLGLPQASKGRYWYATDDRIYAYELVSGTNQKVDNVPAAGLSTGDNMTSASDNEKRVLRPELYQFSEFGQLQSVYRHRSAFWRDHQVIFDGPGEKTQLTQGVPTTIQTGGVSISEEVNPFEAVDAKPGQMDSGALQKQIELSDSETQRQTLNIALQKKYATLFIPLVIALFTAPFSLSLNRRGKVVTVGYAVALWLIFTAVTSLFEQFGVSGSLDHRAAVWGPLVIFTMLGLYLLAKVRT